MTTREGSTSDAESDAITPADSDPGNVLVRAGYLRGLADALWGEDRRFVLKASRSLLAYARSLGAPLVDDEAAPQ